MGRITRIKKNTDLGKEEEEEEEEITTGIRDLNSE
jgi:hypothetical protein